MPLGLVLVNLLFQKILRLNAEVPFLVHFTSRIRGWSSISLGMDVYLSLAVSQSLDIGVADGTKLVIGDGSLIASNVCIRTANHGLVDRKAYRRDSVIIGRNCWIGHASVILPGVVLGDNVTVGAGSVVTTSFPDGSVIAGAPARIIPQRSASEPATETRQEAA